LTSHSQAGDRFYENFSGPVCLPGRATLFQAPAANLPIRLVFRYKRKAAVVGPFGGRVPKDALMATGTVKFFNTSKGFGFIEPSDGGKDVFVHISAVERAGLSSLNEGDKVSFEVVSERGKLAASNLAKA
jgi:cold shock protein